jgi:hypothetical protein
LLSGRYRLGERLGRGGAATVHAGVDIVLGRSVAVKLYQPMDNPTGRFRFATEARLLASLSHPGLVAVHDVNLDGDQPYLVMQLVNGPTLRDLLDRGPLPPGVAARFGARLAEVLAYIHAHDVVHRDIKPSNVLVDESGDCHLTDFGIARALSAAHLTSSGEFVGTAAYLAPEQVTDVDIGPPVDVYALGLLLLECLTGRTEYTGTTVEVALARLTRAPRVPDTLPPRWRALLSAMTAQDPAARPTAARCAELLVALPAAVDEEAAAEVDAEVAAEVKEEPAAVAPVPAARRRFPGRARLVPAAALAAVALAAVAVAIATTSDVPGRPTGESVPSRTQPAGPGAIGNPAPATLTETAGDREGSGDGDVDSDGDGTADGGRAVPAADGGSAGGPAGSPAGGNAADPPAGEEQASAPHTPTVTEPTTPSTATGTEPAGPPTNTPGPNSNSKGKGRG